MTDENTIVKFQSKEIYNKLGSEIIEKNKFFRDLSNIMENPEFNEFFNKYLNNWLDVKSIIIYMKLYAEFKEKYNKINNEELDKEIIVFMLKKVMNDKELRSFSIKTIQEKYDHKKIDFFKELETILINKNKKLLE